MRSGFAREKLDFAFDCNACEYATPATVLPGKGELRSKMGLREHNMQLRMVFDPEKVLLIGVQGVWQTKWGVREEFSPNRQQLKDRRFQATPWWFVGLISGCREIRCFS
jgi:hypothetical protein